MGRRPEIDRSDPEYLEALADAVASIPPEFKKAWNDVEEYRLKHGRLPPSREERERARMLEKLRKE